MDNPPDITRPASFIHVFVPGAANAVTLLLLHGTGGNENSLIELGAELLPDASLLSPRGKVLENGMPRFFRRISEGVFDEEDLHRRTSELATFIKESIAAYNLDPGSIIALGYSNGANIAASLVLSQPRLLAGAVLLRAMVPFEPTELPKIPGLPVLLLSGDRDPLIPHHNANHLAEMLRNAGANVRYSVAHAGHSLTEEELDAIRQFLEDVSTQP
jgi:predicted esterase